MQFSNDALLKSEQAVSRTTDQKLRVMSALQHSLTRTMTGTWVLRP